MLMDKYLYTLMGPYWDRVTDGVQ